MAKQAWRKVWQGAVAALIILTIIAAGLVVIYSVSIPPKSETYAAMQMTKRRTLRFAISHNRFPDMTDSLPLIDGYNNSMVDGWGRQIIIQINGEIVTLISYGRDGQPGGIGEDADVVGSFPMKQADGNWSEENCDWIVIPRSRLD